MLQHSPYYWGSIRKMVECFGVVFSDLHIQRFKQDGTLYQTIEVPCEYGPKEKWLVRNTQNPMPGTDDQVEMVLPRISYELKGWQYDSQRKITSTGRNVQTVTGNNRVLLAQYNPVPYNFSFDLNIMAKNVEDGLMIIEQILPNFTPDYSLDVNDMVPLDMMKRIVIVNSGTVTQEDTYEGSFTDRRTITWALNFTMKGYLYPATALQNITLQTKLRWNVDGGSSTQGANIPETVTIPFPLDATAATVTDQVVANSGTTIIVVALPTTATIYGGQSAVFSVTVVNTTNTDFTVNIPTMTDSSNDRYSIDLVHDTFTYTAGTGIRTSQETIIITFSSVQDPIQMASVTLILNP